LSSLRQEKIWDPVTRLWHWVLVFTVTTGWYFGENLSLSNINWHFYLGYLLLGLMVFRFIWGLYGPAPVRFKNLLPTPSSTIEYTKTVTRRSPSGFAGHNPLGSLWLIAMLLLLSAQGITGLFIEEEDLLENGPLYNYVSEETSNMFDNWHSDLSSILVAMVILHVSVLILYLLWKKENLIKPMISGWKWIREEEKH